MDAFAVFVPWPLIPGCCPFLLSLAPPVREPEGTGALTTGGVDEREESKAFAMPRRRAGTAEA